MKRSTWIIVVVVAIGLGTLIYFGYNKMQANKPKQPGKPNAPAQKPLTPAKAAPATTTDEQVIMDELTKGMVLGFDSWHGRRWRRKHQHDNDTAAIAAADTTAAVVPADTPVAVPVDRDTDDSEFSGSSLFYNLNQNQ